MKYLTLIIFVILFSCRGETPHCYICHINERYVDSHNKVINNYKYSIVLPLEMGMTQREIYLFEDANSMILDENRMIGTIMECHEKR